MRRENIIDLRGYEQAGAFSGGRTLDARELLLPQSEQGTALVDGWLALATAPSDELSIVVDVPLQVTGSLSGDEVMPTAPATHDEGRVLARLYGQGFVDRTPSLAEMVEDDSRTALFAYDGQSSYAKVPDRGKWLWSMREVDGLRDIDQFLGRVTGLALNEDGTIRRDRKRALQKVAPKIASIHENLTFIGEKEFITAAVGLAVFWKSFLEADSKRQILIASNPNTETGMARVLPKSDTFVTDRILSLLCAHDDGSLERRVVHDTQQLTAAPEDTLVAVGDDWLVTGTQMQGRCATLLEKPEMLEYRDSMEIHALAAPEAVIRDGFKTNYGSHPPIKVRAYYAAHDAPEAGNRGNCHTTGKHSAVGFGFATDIEKAADAIQSIIRTKLPMPPLASVYRPYWPKGCLHISES